MPCKLFPSHGRSLFGGSTWSDPLKGQLVASPTCSLPLTNFSSGSRPVLTPASGLSKLCYFFTDIVHRFGVPNCIITDNGTQFTGKKFLDFCDNHHIRVLWSTVAHPKTNGQVERANGMVLQGLKPRIFDKLNKHSKKWAVESSHGVHSVLLSLRIRGYAPN
jgi:transposase InsO family protein